jgi:hypothetical protein
MGRIGSRSFGVAKHSPFGDGDDQRRHHLADAGQARGGSAGGSKSCTRWSATPRASAGSAASTLAIHALISKVTRLTGRPKRRATV